MYEYDLEYWNMDAHSMIWSDPKLVRGTSSFSSREHAVDWYQRPDGVAIPVLPILEAGIVDRPIVSLLTKPFLPPGMRCRRISFGVFDKIVIHTARVHVQRVIHDVPFRGIDARKRPSAVRKQRWSTSI